MAILQISRIQLRRGLRSDLSSSTLTSAELGWAVDTRELYIGNGTLSEGSPLPGQSTRILTDLDLAGISGNGSAMLSTTLSANVSVPTLTTVIDSNFSSVIMSYSITRDLDERTGSMKIAMLSDGSAVAYEDDYVETNNLGITLIPNTTITANSLSMTYTSSSGNPAILTYNSISFI